MSRGLGRIERLILVGATEREDGYTQTQLAEMFVAESAVRRASRSLETKGFVEWIGQTDTGRNVYRITESGKMAIEGKR